MTPDKVWNSSNLDFEESKRIAAIVGAKDQECFTNSLHAIIHLGDESGARYVEGYVVADDFRIVVEHGWIEMGGKIIDCTPTYHSGRTTRRYFPVDRYTREQIWKKLKRRSSLPLEPYPWRKKKWIAAQEQAQRYSWGDQYDRIMDNVRRLSTVNK